MPIKLIKATRDLNVGITTVVDFLHAKGFHIENNPNMKISDEQYTLLVNEFGKELSDAERKGLMNQLAPSPAPHVSPKQVKEEEKKEEALKPEVIKTEIPEEFIPKIVTKGRIDLDNPHGHIQVEDPVRTNVVTHKEVEQPKVKAPEPIPQPIAKEPVVEVKPAIERVIEKEEPRVQQMPIPEEPIVKVVPTTVEEKKEIKNNIIHKPATEVTKEPDQETAKVTTSVAKQPEPEQESSPAADEDIFRLGTPKFESKIKVTGKINLESLNQSTRPKKKTKEERRKEREEKKDRFNENRNKPVPHNNEQSPSASSRPSAPGVKKVVTLKQSSPNASGGSTTEDAAKKKRKRIKKDRVDISNVSGTNTRPSHDRRPQHLKRPVKAEVSEEDVQKQIKETLARLTSKNSKSGKSAKYRKDKRDAAERREHELMEQEERESRILKLTEFVTANDLANMMDVPVTQVISTCMSIGIMVSINQRLDAETINIVADEFGFKTEYVSAEVIDAIKEEEDNEDDWVSRPPIVTVMGHVDHGKTSLLDNIRNANVIAGEAGGITQHIGAYNVKLSSGRRITFLDTPGHEAFTAMRARGAKVTDIAIIIVAADDNVMPQTVEAINHASAAGVPIVFAINKIDKPHANPEKIKEELAAMNYLVEDWGGKYQSQEISAKKGIGVKELLEKVLLEADLLDLKANPKRRASGSIIESSLDKGRGYVATLLVENGTLRQGDVMLAGTHHGKIKAMFNERNQRVESAGPSEPVLVLGLDGAPQAGDLFNVMESEQEAREIANRREQLQRELGLRTQKMLTLDDIGRRIAVGNFQELNVIVKGDVDGSVEALSDSLIRLSTEEIQVNVIHKAVGQISESDVVLAAASNAIIIGFQVRPAQLARRMAEKEGVEIRLYSIIYDTIGDVKSAMEGMLSPEIKEDICGNVEVLQIFKITKVGTVAGCIVKEGKIRRTNKVRVIRDGIVIFTGELGSLKRFKDEVKEVTVGLDCGIFLTNYNDIQVGDIIEAFDETEVRKKL